MAQKTDGGYAKNEHIDPKVFDIASPTGTDPFKRSSNAPKSAEVANWPYPQFAQRQEPEEYIPGMRPVDHIAHAIAAPTYDTRFPRSAQAPTEPEVEGWPFNHRAQTE